MIPKRFIALLIVFALAATSFSSCKPGDIPTQSPDTPPQTSSTSTQPAPEFIPAVNISAIAIPDYDINEAQLEAHPGGVPFKIILYVDPLQPEDLEPAIIEEYEVSEQWDSERVLKLLPPASPITTEFGFFSDGSIYSSADTFTGGTTRSELVSGSDVTFTYATWTQLPADANGDLGIGTRVWYNSFSLDSNTARFISDLELDIQADATEAQTTTEKATTIENYANERKYDFQSDRYKAQYWFVQTPESDPNADPVSLIPETIDIPISPIVTINRVDPELVDSDELIASSGVLIWDFKDDIPLSTSFDSDQLLVNNVFNTTGDLSTLHLYRDYFVASAGSEALGEAVDTTELLYGFSQLANFVDEDPDGSSDCDEGPEVGSFGFVSDGLCFSSVFSVPVDRDSFFSPPEPHIVELPNTYWIFYSEKGFDDDYNSPETVPIADTIVTVEIEPVASGDVELTFQDSIKELYHKDETYGEYSWNFDPSVFEADTEIKEVTLTAIPKYGYKFSHWELDNPIGYYPDLEDELEDQNMASQTITFEIERAVHYVSRVYPLIAHFEPLIFTEEPVPTVQETLYTSLDANGQCWASQSSCSCNIVIVIEGTDLTDGSYPLTNVTLTVNGENWHDSGSISETHYTRTVERSVNCDAEFNIEVTATNSIGQTISATGHVSTARN